MNWDDFEFFNIATCQIVTVLRYVLSEIILNLLFCFWSEMILNLLYQLFSLLFCYSSKKTLNLLIFVSAILLMD